jgi:anti-sigma B factor antagonist
MLSRAKNPDHSRPSPTAFGTSRRELDSRTSVCEVEGELDLSTAPRLKWLLVDALEAGHSRIVLDLSGVTFIDSTALGVLVSVKRRLGDSGRLAIVCARPNVLKIFEFAGVDGAFAIFPTLEDALAHAEASTS